MTTETRVRPSRDWQKIAAPRVAPQPRGRDDSAKEDADFIPPILLAA